MSFLKVTGAESIFFVPSFSISKIARPLSTKPEESNRKIPSTPAKPLGLVKASVENVSTPSLLAIKALCAKKPTKAVESYAKDACRVGTRPKFFLNLSMKNFRFLIDGATNQAPTKLGSVLRDFSAQFEVPRYLTWEGSIS